MVNMGVHSCVNISVFFEPIMKWANKAAVKEEEEICCTFSVLCTHSTAIVVTNLTQ